MTETYNTLEFDRILDALAGRCHSDTARQKMRHLEPYNNINDLHDMMACVREAMTIHRFLGRLPLEETADIRGALKTAEMDGTLGVEELVNIGTVLTNIESLKTYFQSWEGEPEALRDWIDGLSGDAHLRDEIERIIMPDLSIADDASGELYRIRRSLARMQTSIRSKMERYVKDGGNDLSLDRVTSRNDHLVLAVKADKKNAYKGIIHATSQTGGTYFIEPEDVVAMNNDMALLREQEQQEILRILRGLSRNVKHITLSLTYDCDIMETLDVIFARADYGNAMDACVAEVNREGTLMLRSARHPLIDQRKVVANDIVLPSQALMITGSNTGGKTVTLKTIGLLSLMAACAIPVTCEKADVPLYDAIYVDMGDDSSITASLSTYSAHMTKLIGFLKSVTRHSLVMIDEIGSGTDPDEGAALAKALIDAFLARGGHLAVTTHYGQLKTYAELKEDITPAAVGFNMETMKPTYKLSIGETGGSYAFEIATSLGLDPAIIKAGRQYRKDGQSEAEQLYDRLTKQEQRLKDKEQTLRREQKDVRVLKDKYDKQMAGMDKMRQNALKEAKEEANQLLEQARQDIDAIKKDLKASSNLKPHEAIAAKKALESLKYEDEPEQVPQDHDFVVGDHVRINRVKQEGDVTDIRRGKLTVDVNGLPMQVKVSDVTFLHPRRAEKKVAAARTPKVKKTGSYEVNVIGMRYQEAMDTVDKFIDDALVMGYSSVRIIHGLGTGALRNGVRQLLNRNKNIESYRDGGPDEGGSGATVAYFK